MVSDIQNKVLNNVSSMFAPQLTEYACQLAVLLSNVGQEVADREVAYRKKLLAIIEEKPDLSFAKAELESQTSDEYLTYRKAKAVEKSIEETEKALKNRANALRGERDIVQST